MSGLPSLDSSSGDEKRNAADKAVRESPPVYYRRDCPWPFLFSVLPGRGLVINKAPPRKKGEIKVGEALW